MIQREMVRLSQELRAVRLTSPVQCEAELRNFVRDVLVFGGHYVRCEVRINGIGRVDIFVDGGIVIECKRGKPNVGHVRRQVSRYAMSQRVTGVIIVSERGLMGLSDGYVNGKPVAYVALSLAWGV